MNNKVYQGTIESLLQNEVFVSEFLQGVRRIDFSRLIEDGIFAKLFIADVNHERPYGASLISGNDKINAMQGS